MQVNEEHAACPRGQDVPKPTLKINEQFSGNKGNETWERIFAKYTSKVRPAGSGRQHVSYRTPASIGGWLRLQ